MADAQDEEPLYGPAYLPRKFKIGIAVPPSNDIDVFTQDLGFVAIVADGRLAGFNVLVGGGMGTTHGEPATYPQLASGIGFCLPEKVLQVAETVDGHPTRLRRSDESKARPAEIYDRRPRSSTGSAMS